MHIIRLSCVLAVPLMTQISCSKAVPGCYGHFEHVSKSRRRRTTRTLRMLSVQARHSGLRTSQAVSRGAGWRRHGDLLISSLRYIWFKRLRRLGASGRCELRLCVKNCSESSGHGMHERDFCDGVKVERYGMK